MISIDKRVERTAHREAQARTRLFVEFIEEFYDSIVLKPCGLDLTIDDENPATQFRMLYNALQESEGALIDKREIDIDKRFRQFQEELNVFSPAIAPYSKSYERIFASLIECVELQEAEKHLIDFVFERYWEPADALHIRYNWQILQERANQLEADETSEAKDIRLPRLNAAIDWLKDYEQRLAVAAVDSTVITSSSIRPTHLSTSTSTPPTRLKKTAQAPTNPTLDTPVPSAPPPLLNSAVLILGGGFTLEEADRLALALELIDAEGNYCLGPRKLGAVVGFALALQQAGKLTGTIPALTAVLAPRWGVQVATRKTSTGIAKKYFKLTNTALALPKKTD